MKAYDCVEYFLFLYFTLKWKRQIHNNKTHTYISHINLIKNGFKLKINTNCSSC